MESHANNDSDEVMYSAPSSANTSTYNTHQVEYMENASPLSVALLIVNSVQDIIKELLLSVDPNQSDAFAVPNSFKTRLELA